MGGFQEQIIKPFLYIRESINKNELIEDKMGAGDTVVLIIFGLILPTTDVYSDISFAVKLFWNGHPRYAWSMLTPVILSFLFMIVHWLRMESTLKKRLISLPFLILQIWPQVQVCKILKMGLYDKNQQWRKRKETMDRDVSSVGKNYLIHTFLQYFYFLKLQLF